MPKFLAKPIIAKNGGDEGGELLLEKADTNTTISTGVTIDVYQNKLRFFEQGGNARGAYIDITSCSNGVATNLLSGGGGSSGPTAVTTSITANTTTTIDTFSATTYRSAEYLVQITQGTKYTVSKVLLIHDGTTPTMTEYGVVEIGASRIPVTVSTTISGGNVLLQVTITDAATTNATVKALPTYMAA